MLGQVWQCHVYVANNFRKQQWSPQWRRQGTHVGSTWSHWPVTNQHVRARRRAIEPWRAWAKGSQRAVRVSRSTFTLFKWILKVVVNVSVSLQWLACWSLISSRKYHLVYLEIPCITFKTEKSFIAHPWIQRPVVVRRAGLLWSQQDFEWRWSVPLFKCLTVLEFSFILFDLCLLITFFNFILNYVPIVTFWIFTYHKIWILSIMFCSIWSYWMIYFLACLEVSWRVVS